MSGVKSTRKRSRDNQNVCHFCGEQPTAVVVRVPAIQSRKASPPQTYCLLHYYTTSAVRLDTKYVTIQDQAEVDRQLPAVQELFAEAYVQLQQELAQESARSFTKHQHDPLAILHDISKSPRHKTPVVARRKSADNSGGGFMKNIPLPSRLMKTQRQQALMQQEMIRRLNKSSETKNKPKDLSKRRKSSRKSIWNVVMDHGTEEPAPAEQVGTQFDEDANAPDATCTCGSNEVSIVGSSSSRNQEATKGEIWGNKDRGDETVVRYQCQKCCRTWNEEE